MPGSFFYLFNSMCEKTGWLKSAWKAGSRLVS